MTGGLQLWDLGGGLWEEGVVVLVFGFFVKNICLNFSNT